MCFAATCPRPWISLPNVALSPNFPQEEVDREKKKRLDALTQANNNPNAIAQRLGPMLAYGPSHPYGRPGQGFPSTVEKLGAEDLSRFHAAYWKPASSALIFAGDITLRGRGGSGTPQLRLLVRRFCSAACRSTAATRRTRQSLYGGSRRRRADCSHADPSRPCSFRIRLLRPHARRCRMGRRRRGPSRHQHPRGKRLLLRSIFVRERQLEIRSLDGQRRRADEQDQGSRSRVPEGVEIYRRRQASLRKGTRRRPQ